MFVFIGVAVFIVVNLTVLTFTSRQTASDDIFENITISLTAPFQWGFTSAKRTAVHIWETYFFSVQAARENKVLHTRLLQYENVQNKNTELTLENQRLKRLLHFSPKVPDTYVAARIVGRDPSPWFQTVVIDRGRKHGVCKASPVIVAEGIVGRVISAGKYFSKVLLITDRSSAVDALVQNTRVRGMVRGGNKDECSFVYTLRKDQVTPGEVIVSSGLDQVFPKGLVIGRIHHVEKEQSYLFQDITIETSVDFDQLEEVLVMQGKIHTSEVDSLFQ